MRGVVYTLSRKFVVIYKFWIKKKSNPIHQVVILCKSSDIFLKRSGTVFVVTSFHNEDDESTSSVVED